jgi:small GTP-binding protein
MLTTTRRIDLTTKLVLIGETAVGKSSLVLRITSNDFVDRTTSTVGAAFVMKFLSINNKNIKLEIWDTAGQERFHCLVPMYYRDAKVALVVYDVTDTTSFYRAKDWIIELEDKGPKNILIVVVGNKIDLNKNKNNILANLVKEYIKEKQFLYAEVSAKTGEGVNELLEIITNKLFDPNYKMDYDTNTNTTNEVKLFRDLDNSDSVEKRWYCC